MNVCKYQVVSIGIIVFLIGVGIFLMFIPYMWEGEVLNKWASAVTILSLIGVPIAYFTKQDQKEKEKNQKEKDERSRASRNLYGELKDAMDGLDETKYNDLQKLSMNGKDDVYFMNRFLNHDVYDSLINSGKINFLKYELQQKVQNIFQQIKKHNQYLKYTAELQDGEKNNDVPESAYRYYELFGNYEKLLLKEIPEIMKKLEEEFDFEPPDN